MSRIDAASRQPSERRGSVLTWFASLLFVLLPLAALVIDVSFVRLSRRQMQTAVNTAALEGLRFRDDIPISTLSSLVDCPGCTTEADFYQHVRDHDTACNCPTVTHAQVRDYLRRRLAGRLIQAEFDDDLLSTIADPLHLGAGPDLNYIDGTELAGPGSFRAGTTIEIPDPRTYKPNPVLNHADNDPSGDFVSGDYDVTDGLHDEGPAFLRSDFAPTTTNADAFLSRMRRSIDPVDPTIGSTGPPIPFLFGRGAITAAIDSFPESYDDEPTALGNRRERGTVVRATSIAHAVRAMRVGVPSLPEVPLGVADCWLDCAAWSAISDGDVLTVDGSGQVFDPLMLLVGQMRTDEAFVPAPTARRTTSVGDAQPVSSVPSVSADSIGHIRFAPLTLSISGVNRVVGFGRITVVSSTELRKDSAVIASQNASAAIGMPTNLSGAEWTNLFNASAPFAGQFLLAPALMRTIP